MANPQSKSIFSPKLKGNRFKTDICTNSCFGELISKNMNAKTAIF